MNVIHMKKPGVYKRPARALEPSKPFRMRDPETYEWTTFIPVFVTYTLGICSQCAFCRHNGDSCNIQWEPEPSEDGKMILHCVGLCIQHIKGHSFMKRNLNGSVVFKRVDALLEDL